MWTTEDVQKEKVPQVEQLRGGDSLSPQNKGDESPRKKISNVVTLQTDREAIPSLPNLPFKVNTSPPVIPQDKPKSPEPQQGLTAIVPKSPEPQRGAAVIVTAVPPKPIPLKKVRSDVGVPKIPLYPPLEALKRKRGKEIAYTPIMPLMEATPLAKPEQFLYLEEGVKNNLLPAAVKIDAVREKKVFLQGTCELLRQIVNGKCQILSEATNEKYSGIEHPCQLEAVFNFIDMRIKAFNESLVDVHKFADQDIAAFFEQFGELKEIAEIWNRLWELAQGPYLAENEVLVLQECGEKLPDCTSTFYSDYPAITTRLRELVGGILSKLILIKAPPASLVALGMNLSDKLDVNFTLHTPQSVANNHAHIFFEQLTQNTLQLFQTSKKNNGLEEPKFIVAHIYQIFSYIVEEIKFLNEAAIEIMVNRFGLAFEGPIPYIFSYQVFEDIQPLLWSWREMEKMLFGEKGIDEKIESLEKIAATLPEKDADAWEKYSRIKDGMDATLTPLALCYFSNYSFDQVNDDIEKYNADKKRKERIDRAFELMAKKLGCQAPKPPEKEMDIRSDDAMQNAENKREFESHAVGIMDIYRQNLEFGHAFAAEQAASNIYSIRLQHIQANEKANFAQRILNAMRDRRVAAQIGQCLRKRIR